MNEKNYINYGLATYSLAMIDFKNNIQILNNVDEQLDEANFILSLILSKNIQNEDYAEVLKRYVLPAFGKVNKFIGEVRKQTSKYEKRLSSYLLEHADKEEQFNKLKQEMMTILDSKESFVKSQIQSCFNYIKEAIDTQEQGL